VSRQKVPAPSRAGPARPGPAVASHGRTAGLNTVQDNIVDVYAGKRGDRTRVIAPIVGELTNMDFDEPNGRLASISAPWSIAMPITVFEGDRIKAITIARFGTAGANQATLRLIRISSAGTRTQLQNRVDHQRGASVVGHHHDPQLTGDSSGGE
jgi:hypothetical protein